MPSPPSHVTSDEMQRLKRAYDRVKLFPEFNPDERAHWLELRQALERYLARWG